MVVPYNTLAGPRPALWNQDLLTAERDKYGANDVKPGLTGWAQINGRDELTIEEKAKLDGEYRRKELQRPAIYIEYERLVDRVIMENKLQQVHKGDLHEKL